MAIKIYADAGSNLFKGIIEKRNALKVCESIIFYK